MLFLLNPKKYTQHQSATALKCACGHLLRWLGLWKLKTLMLKCSWHSPKSDIFGAHENGAEEVLAFREEEQTDEDDDEIVLASCDQELTDEELMKMILKWFWYPMTKN